MKKGWILVIVISCAVLFVTSGILIAADTPDEIIIEGKGYKKDKKEPVKFSHGKHIKDIGIACVECHHEYKDGNNVWTEGNEVKKCEECHNPDKSEGNVKKLMVVFHKNCQTCHKEKKDQGLEAPDKKCENCHMMEETKETKE